MKTIASALLAFTAFAAVPVSGQPNIDSVKPSEEIRVPAGASILAAFPDTVRLRYKDYGWGRVVFANGQQSELHRFNYDLLLEDILVIRPQGDTVIFDDSNLIRLVLINDATYLLASDFKPANRRQPYFEIVAEGDGLLLGIRNAYFFTNKKQRVDPGYNSYADYCVSAYTFRNAGGRWVLPNEDYVWKGFSIYYAIDKTGHSFRFNKAFLRRFYPQYRELIDNYLKTTPTDFQSGADLEKLFAYCTKLRG